VVLEQDKAIAEKPKTVIFSHHGAMFLPGDNINKNWNVIRPLHGDDIEETKRHYEKEIIEVGKSWRQYIFVWYDTIIADMFERLLHDPSRPEYKEWRFMSFFHRKKTTETNKLSKRIMASWRRYILASMKQYDYIIKYVIPYCHILTDDDMREINDFWEAPNRVDDIDELKKRKPKFPIMAYPLGGALGMRRNKRIQELLA